MEAKTRFIQNKTVSMTFAQGTATADISVPFAVDKVIVQQMATDGNSSTFQNIVSDLFQWNSVGVLYCNNNAATTAQTGNTYYFQTPTKIQGRYTFQTKNMKGVASTVLNTHGVTIIFQFIREGEL